MIHQPIEPKHTGCPCCNNVGQILDKETWLDVGFGSVDFKIKYENGQSLERQYIGGVSDSEDQVTKVKDLEEEYADRMKKAKCVTLFFFTPLHDETYEYNQVDSQWYLIVQGRGFA